MNPGSENDVLSQPEPPELIEKVGYHFGVSRRDFVQVLGVGLMFVVSASSAVAQRNEGRGGNRNRKVSARIHIGADGKITVLTGKVEMGQGARAELSQAAAEELRVPPGEVQVL